MNSFTNEQIMSVQALAIQGLTTKAIAKQLGLTQQRVYTIVRELDIEAPWKVRRRARHELQEQLRATKKAESDANKISPAYLVRRYFNGETLDAIGNSVDLSPERVRQIIIEGGYSVKELRAQRKAIAEQQLAQQQQALISWIESHKGCTTAEIEAEFGTTMEELNGLLTPRLRALILTDDDKQNTGDSAYTKWSHEQILFALKQAAKRTSPLTKEAYDQLVTSKSVMGPVGSRIVHIYKSWSIACAIAGVESGEAVRDNYVKDFSTSDLIEALIQFIHESESLSPNSYDRWESQRDGLPSGITIRLKFGSWTAARRRALIHLRSNWLTTSSNI